MDKIRIVCAGDLPMCLFCGVERYCPIHQMHYADCSCVGPADAEELGYTVHVEDGQLVGVRL